MIEQGEAPNSGALSWMLEMELLNNPPVLNSIILNIFRILPGVKDAEFVIDANNKKLLIYLKLTRWAHWFQQKKISDMTLELLDQALPRFTKRVVFDRNILEKALKLLKERDVGDIKREQKNTPRTDGALTQHHQGS